MRTIISKTLFVTFNIIFTVIVLSIFTANRLYSISVFYENEKLLLPVRLDLLETAQLLTPMNAELNYAEYRLLENSIRSSEEKSEKKEIRKKQLFKLKKAINLRPAWPLYHMVYALTLSNSSKNPNIMTRQTILSEMKKSVELKPFSKKYVNIYEKYKKRN